MNVYLSNLKMIKHSLFGAALLLFQGCTTLNSGALSLDSSSGAYNPMTIDGVDANKFKMDKQQCYKQVQTDAATPMSDYYNVIKFRDCLVKKGYVLMS